MEMEDKLIEDLEAINRRVGFTFTAVVDAIKVVKMWREIKHRSRHNVFCGQRIQEYANEIEEEFFPSIIHQTIKVRIQGKDDASLHEIRQYIFHIKGVNEVRT